MAIEAQKIVTVGSLPGQIFQQLPDSDIRTPDGRNIVQGASGIKLEDIGGGTKYTTKAMIRAMGKNGYPTVSENVNYITFDKNGGMQIWNYDPANTGGYANNGASGLQTADGKRLKIAKNGQYLNLLWFDGIDPTGVNDSTAGWLAAMKELTQSGWPGLFIPDGDYLISDDYVFTNNNTNIHIFGKPGFYASGLFGSKIHYTGTGNLLTFGGRKVVVAGLCIYTKSTDANYKQGSGILVNGNGIEIKDCFFSGLNNGLILGPDNQATAQSVLYNRLTRIAGTDCNIGIKQHDNGQPCNGNIIESPYFWSNGTGIECGGGQGNMIRFGACELANNTNGDIRLLGGNWSLSGASWMEGTAPAIIATGGIHTIDNDIYCIAQIKEQGGYIICDSPQQGTSIPFSGINRQDLKFWFSFDELTGSKAYSREVDRYLNLSETATWLEEGFYKTGIKDTVDYASKITDCSGIDLSKDWTLLMIVKGFTGAGSLDYALRFTPSDASTPMTFTINVNQFRAQIGDVGGGNCSSYPHDLYDNDYSWLIFSYKAATGETFGYTTLGVPYSKEPSKTFTIPASFANISEIALGKNYSFDEIILYNRILTPKEIYSITRNNYLPRNKVPSVNNSSSLKIITDSYTLTLSDYTIIYTGSATGLITLPDPTTCKDKIFVINCRYQGGSITTSRSLREDTSTTTTDIATNTTVTIQSDGTEWWIISIQPN